MIRFSAMSCLMLFVAVAGLRPASARAQLGAGGLFETITGGLTERVSILRTEREDAEIVYERHPSVSAPGFGFGYLHRLATFGEPVSKREIDALLKRHERQLLDPARLRARIEAEYARKGRRLDPRAKVSYPKLVDGLRALLEDRGAFAIWSEFLGRGGTLDLGYGRYTPVPLRITATAEDTYTTSDGKRVPGDVIDTQKVLLHEALHFGFDLADTRIAEHGIAEDHEPIHVIEERIQLMQLMRSGQAPVSDGRLRVEMLSGEHGALLEDLSSKDPARLRARVEAPEFFDRVLARGMSGILKAVERSRDPAVSGGYVFSDGEVRDLERASAVNAALAQQALRLAAQVSAARRKKPAQAFATSEFQSRLASFLAAFGPALDADASASVRETATRLMDTELALLPKKR